VLFCLQIFKHQWLHSVAEQIIKVLTSSSTTGQGLRASL
jgi:hypothetical protein